MLPITIYHCRSRDQDKERERGDRSDRGGDRKLKEDKIKEEKDVTVDASVVLKNDELIIQEAVKEQATECVEIKMEEAQ